MDELYYACKNNDVDQVNRILNNYKLPPTKKELKDTIIKCLKVTVSGKIWNRLVYLYINNTEHYY